MKIKTHWLALALGFFISMSTSSCKNESQNYTVSPEPSPEQKSETLVDRGKYLVDVIGCHDCHSPKRMGPNGPERIPELLLSGYPSDRPIVNFDSPLLKEGFSLFYPDLTAAAGPWGISFAGNLTPDETGIGNWSEEQFKIAMTRGKFKGIENGRLLLPPMPWLTYSNLSDEDLSAMFQYLQSITPVRNIVPAPAAPEEL